MVLGNVLLSELMRRFLGFWSHNLSCFDENAPFIAFLPSRQPFSLKMNRRELRVYIPISAWGETIPTKVT